MSNEKLLDKPVVISFYSYRGGTGKSTISSNLAKISSEKFKTILLDLDLYSPQLNYVFGIENELYINDYFHSSLFDFSKGKDKGVDLKDIICKSSYNNLDLILANPKISLSDNTILHNETTTKKLFPCMQHIIEQLKGKYDIIIVDCPGELNFYTLNAIAVSDRAVGAIMPTIANIKGMIELLSIFDNILKGKVSDIILTMVSARISNKKNQQMADWEIQFKQYNVENFLNFVYSEDISYRHQFESDFFYLPQDIEYQKLKTYLDSILE